MKTSRSKTLFFRYPYENIVLDACQPFSSWEPLGMCQHRFRPDHGTHGALQRVEVSIGDDTGFRVDA